MTPTHINIAGIVLNRDGFQPLAGIRVTETISKQETTTDANGFYSMNVSADGDKPSYHLKLHWKGRLLLSNNVSRQHSAEPLGQIQIDVVNLQKEQNPHEQLHSPYYPSPPDPQYADALQAAQLAIKEHEKTLRFYAMQKAHPEISRFYATGDGWRRLVLFRDGRVEAYGGPDEPDFTTMDFRYAPLPWFMVPNYSQPRRDKPSNWQEIARRLQQDFHANPTDTKAIVFPGDSEALVINATGDTEAYSLFDTDSPRNQRSDFEARFGQLPDYVPKAIRRPGTDTYDIVYSEGEQNPGREMITLVRDTVIEHVNLSSGRRPRKLK
jgi:hypothetical protein